jgi:hypothetical protein
MTPRHLRALTITMTVVYIVAAVWFRIAQADWEVWAWYTGGCGGLAMSWYFGLRVWKHQK